jgi:hypothetical protein
MTATTRYYVEIHVADAAEVGAAVEHLAFLNDISPVQDADRNPQRDLIAYTCHGISQGDAYRHAGQVTARLRHAGIDADVVSVSKRS